MRILPSQSRGTKRNVGSSSALTISRSRPSALGDPLPVAQARAAQRVDAELQPGAADRVEVDHRAEVVDVGGDVVAATDLGALVGHALDAVEPRLEQRVGLLLDAARDVGVGRAAVRRVVLEAAVAGRVVRRGDDDPVGRAAAAAAVVGQDRVRDHRRRRGAVVGVEHDVDPVRAQHLDDRARRRLGQRVRVAAEEQRPVDPLRGAVAADRLGDREHVRLVERARGRGAAVAGGPEADALGRLRRVGPLVVVGGEQRIDVDQGGGVRQLTGVRVDAHGRECARSAQLAESSATTTLTSSGRRSSASCQRSSGTRRVISARSQSRSASASASRRGLVVAAVGVHGAEHDVVLEHHRAVEPADVEVDRATAGGDAGEADDAVARGARRARRRRPARPRSPRSRCRPGRPRRRRRSGRSRRGGGRAPAWGRRSRGRGRGPRSPAARPAARPAGRSGPRRSRARAARRSRRAPPIRSICSHAFATTLVGSSRTPTSSRPGSTRTANSGSTRQRSEP